MNKPKFKLGDQVISKDFKSSRALRLPKVFVVRELRVSPKASDGFCVKVTSPEVLVWRYERWLHEGYYRKFRPIMLSLIEHNQRRHAAKKLTI